MSKYKIAIPEVPIAREDIPDLVFEKSELLTGEKGKRGDNDQLLKIINEADAIIFTSANNITAELMKSAPNLKIAFKSGAWPENIDWEYAKENGIAVGWTPGANAQSVAEYTVLFMLASVKRLFSSAKILDQGGWREGLVNGEDLNSKTVGLLGIGAIGAHVAKFLQGFGTNVVAYDPFIDDEAFEKIGVSKISSFDDLLTMADIISIHCLLTDQTRHIFNDQAFKKMKPSAILVNTARGGMIDEKALIKALKEGQIAGAALDVFEQEPLPLDSGLRNLDNVILTPHISARSKESAIRETVRAIEGAISYLDGQEPVNARIARPDKKDF